MKAIKCFLVFKLKINKLKMNTKNKISAIAGMALLASVLVFSSVSADTNNKSGAMHRKMPQQGVHNTKDGKSMKPAVIGTVTAVNGNSITVASHPMRPMGTNNQVATTTYSVDATNATVNKNNATSTVQNITVGDMVLVQGTISGTNVTATMIRDNSNTRANFATSTMPRRMDRGRFNASSSTMNILDNGQPVIAGNVTSVSGNIITISNSNNASYTIDATNAKITTGKDTVTIQSVAIGDGVIAQGTVNGNSMTATTVVERPVSQMKDAKTNKPGVFENVKNFIKNIFKF